MRVQDWIHLFESRAQCVRLESSAYNDWWPFEHFWYATIDILLANIPLQLCSTSSTRLSIMLFRDKKKEGKENEETPDTKALIQHSHQATLHTWLKTK